VSERQRRLVWFAAIAAGVAMWAIFIATAGVAVDAHAYAIVDPLHPYPPGMREGDPGTFVYTPAFAQAVAPLQGLGELGFAAIWRGLETTALFLMAGPLAGVLLFVQPFAPEVAAGNIALLLGLAIVAGFRWPAAWSFVLLTKVTPGVGLVWFLVRREWRQLAIALGATAAIAAVSFAIAPSAWFDWLSMLAGQTAPVGALNLVAGPLWLRVLAAAALVAWGGLTDRRWTVVVGAFIALPLVWPNSAAMLAGLLALRGFGLPVLADRRAPQRMTIGAETPTKAITVMG
jgi:hypothetical protein